VTQTRHPRHPRHIPVHRRPPARARVLAILVISPSTVGRPVRRPPARARDRPSRATSHSSKSSYSMCAFLGAYFFAGGFVLFSISLSHARLYQEKFGELESPYLLIRGVGNEVTPLRMDYTAYVSSNIYEIWLIFKLMMICLFLIDLIDLINLVCCNIKYLWRLIDIEIDDDLFVFDWFDKCRKYVTSNIYEIWLILKLMMICLFLIDLIDLINVGSM
jgi:hypothetical protein